MVKFIPGTLRTLPCVAWLFCAIVCEVPWGGEAQYPFRRVPARRASEARGDLAVPL